MAAAALAAAAAASLALRPGMSKVAGSAVALSSRSGGGGVLVAGGSPAPGLTIGVASERGGSPPGLADSSGFLARGLGAGLALDEAGVEAGVDALGRGLAGVSPSGVSSGVSLGRLGLRGLAGGSKITSPHSSCLNSTLRGHSVKLTSRDGSSGTSCTGQSTGTSHNADFDPRYRPSGRVAGSRCGN